MSQVYSCNRCLAKFRNFKSLVLHYESKHDGTPHRELRDTVAYLGPDSGCELATEYLGRKSFCLKCPFPKCRYDAPGVGIRRSKKKSRDIQIFQRWQQRESVENLAVIFKVSERTVKRAIAKGGKDV